MDEDSNAALSFAPNVVRMPMTVLEIILVNALSIMLISELWLYTIIRRMRRRPAVLITGRPMPEMTDEDAQRYAAYIKKTSQALADADLPVPFGMEIHQKDMDKTSDASDEEAASTGQYI